MMNLSHTLDPQIAQLLAERPSRRQLLQYITGQASPVLSEIIEAHMQRSPGVRQNVEFLLREIEPETFSEDTYHRLRRLIQRDKDTDAPLHMRPGLDDLSRYLAEMAPSFQDELHEARTPRFSEDRMDVEALLELDSEFDKALEESLKQLESEAASARIGDISARDSHELALAGAERIDPPSKLVLEPAEGLGGILGLCCVASASVEAPVYATTFRLSFRGREQAQGVPNRIKVKWPTGDRLSRPFEFRDERWRSDVVLPVGWRTVSIWLKNGAVSFVAASE
jgi:hypothetical protein